MNDYVMIVAAAVMAIIAVWLIKDALKVRRQVIAKLDETIGWLDELKNPTIDQSDLLETAWGIIANSYGGNWDKATDDWRGAAERWRDEYHKTLPDLSDAPEIVKG